MKRIRTLLLYFVIPPILFLLLILFVFYFMRDSTVFLESENIALQRAILVPLPRSVHGVYFEKNTNSIIVIYEGMDEFSRIDIETNLVTNMKGVVNTEKLVNRVNTSLMVRGVPFEPPHYLESMQPRHPDYGVPPALEEILPNDNLLVLNFSWPYTRVPFFSTKKYCEYLMMDFYEITFDNSDLDEESYKTLFLGAFQTNYYLPTPTSSDHITLSSDGKYIVVLTRGVPGCKKLGDNAGRDTLLVWKVGANTKEDNLFRTELKPGFWRKSPGNIVPIPKTEATLLSFTLILALKA